MREARRNDARQDRGERGARSEAGRARQSIDRSGSAPHPQPPLPADRRERCSHPFLGPHPVLSTGGRAAHRAHQAYDADAPEPRARLVPRRQTRGRRSGPRRDGLARERGGNRAGSGRRRAHRPRGRFLDPRRPEPQCLVRRPYGFHRAGPAFWPGPVVEAARFAPGSIGRAPHGRQRKVLRPDIPSRQRARPAECSCR